MAEFTVEMLAQAIRELAEEVEGAKAMASACSVAVIAALSVTTQGHPDRLAMATGLAESLESQILSYDGTRASQRLRLMSEQGLLRIAVEIRREFGLPPKPAQVRS